MNPGGPSSAPARWRRRPRVVGLAILTIVVTIAVAAAMRPVGLAEVLLVVLVEVVIVSLFAGRTVAGATAVGAVLAVNWFLVPPYGTFEIQAQENWVSLAVFLFLSVGVSTLVEVVLGSERAAAAATARQAVMTEVLRPDSASARDSLKAFRSALDLDEAALLAPTTGEVLLRSARDGADPAPQDPVIDVQVAPGFRVVGRGGEIMGVNREFADTLATAVVRAWESQELVAEQERSARLAEVDRARATLLASVGHDLRTPLAGIRVSADALLMAGGTLSEADRVELLDGLRQSAIRLDEVLGALLDSSRIDAGVLQVDKHPADLAEVAGRAVAAWESPRIVLVPPGRPVVAVTDAVLLERILANLVANALVHTPAGSPVEVVVAEGPQGASVRVIDHGPGLAAESADVGRSRHGMGLLIVDRLAELIGAGTSYDPTPGGGLTATVRVPT
jgi:two-component system, OmpR family, sensor histidine kinase KdpD